MYPDELVFGLLNTSARINDSKLSTKLRSFTIAWSRYGYRGRFIEHDTLNRILDEAVELGYRWCLIQAYGHILSERWSPRPSDGKPPEVAIGEWLATRKFFVTGRITGDQESGFGIDDQFLMVNLEQYVAWGRPAYDRPVSHAIECVKPLVAHFPPPNDSGIATLAPSTETIRPVILPSGWNFVEASLRNGVPVYGFEPNIDSNRIHLGEGSQKELSHFSSYLDRNILNYEPSNGSDGLAKSQHAFLDSIHRVVSNSKRGVFLWNLEPYDDVLIPPTEFKPPVSTLYSVAAGFKPNFILESLGFDDATHVVFFDYSPDALKVRRMLTEEWDGEDLPRFIRYLFQKLPSPETFYYLWSGFTPATVPQQELQAFWEMEIQKWGGEDKIRKHWARYKQLRHSYIVCNILAEADSLVAQMERQANAVIWWSNAFFTMYSNWFFTTEERHRIYGDWIKRLAAKNPELFLYGSDYNNISVNNFRAGEYLERFANGGDDYLNPVKLNKVEIRF